MTRITVKKQPNEKGLRSVGLFARGFIVSVAGIPVGTVASKDRDGTAWYWYARLDVGEGPDPTLIVPFRNTFHKPVRTKEEARDACCAYIKECVTKGVL